MQWIAISEQLPQLETGMYSISVLGWAESYGDFCVCYYDYTSKRWWEDLMVGKDRVINSNVLPNVSHWMPLPEPPDIVASTLASIAKCADEH